ncbi:hypothetical protein D3C81_2059010 [compost metagenome]
MGSSASRMAAIIKAADDWRSADDHWSALSARYSDVRRACCAFVGRAPCNCDLFHVCRKTPLGCHSIIHIMTSEISILTPDS